MPTQEDRGKWLRGTKGQCCREDTPPARPLRLVLLGAPGVGKGTQAEMISAQLGACQLSTGDVFRAAKTADIEELGGALKEALECMARGELVRDETVVDLVRERVKCLLCPYGFLLDGFPRTVEQARALDRILEENSLELDAVLSYELPLDEVIERLSGRRTCRQCTTTFHLKNMPPKVEGVCDKCGGELFQRDDDKPASIRVRLKAYDESTAPLVGYYRERSLLRTVSAAGSPADVFARTKRTLEEFFTST